jgi:hypothetical protein
MAQQIIAVGAVPNDGNGDKLRDGFIKVNANDTELYNKDANLQSQIDALSVDVSKIFFDATIGATGADFTTFKLAVDAGNKIINAIDDTTEVGDSTIDGVYLYINDGVTCDFAGFNVKATSDNIRFDKEGAGDILYTSTTVSKVFFDQDIYPNCSFSFKGGTFRNESTQANCFLNNAKEQLVKDCAINLPNINGGGLSFNNENCGASNATFIGGGALCSVGLLMNQGWYRNIFFDGVFDLTAFNYAFLSFSSNTSSTGFHSRVVLNISVGSTLFSGFSSKDPNNLNIRVDDNEAIYNNGFMNGGSFDLINQSSRLTFSNISVAKFINTSGSDNCVLSNCKIASSTLQLDFSNSSLYGCKLSSTGDLTFTGDNVLIDGLYLPNGDIRILGDKCTLTGCSANNIIIGADLADPTIVPPTEVLGDQYYLDPLAVGAVDAAWDGNAKGTTVEFDGATWTLINTPTNTICTSNRTNSGTIIDNGVDTLETTTSTK